MGRTVWPRFGQVPAQHRTARWSKPSRFRRWPQVCHLIESGLESRKTDGFQAVQCADRVGLCSVERHLKRRLDVALRRQVVKFVRLSFQNKRHHHGKIGDVSVVQREIRIGKDGFQAGCVERAGFPFDSVYPIPVASSQPCADSGPFSQQELRKVRAILTRNTCDQSHLSHSDQRRHICSYA